MSGELAAERWSPVQRVESVLLSIISLLDDAECSSPANVDAGVMLRKNPEEHKRLVSQDVELSKTDIPEGFVMPTHSQLNQIEKIDDKEFWFDSEVEDDFGGSDTDAEIMADDFDELPDQDSVNDDEEEEEEEENAENSKKEEDDQKETSVHMD